MCRLCLKYGAGTKWYLNPKNYTDEVIYGDLAKLKMEDTIAGSMFGVKGTIQEVLSTAERFKWEVGFGEYIDLVFQDLDDEMAHTFREGLPDLIDKTHAVQVVPLEDAEKIIDLTRGDIRIENCICRKYYGGKEKMCEMVFSPFAEERQKNMPWWKAKVVSKEKAKNELRELDKEGLIHTIAWLPAPIPALICNCEYPHCIALKVRLHYNVVDAFRKGEYASYVDPNKCDGCNGMPQCQVRCSFGALKYSPTSGKVRTNQMQCWGCGVCRPACPHNAIKLISREEIPQLKAIW